MESLIVQCGLRHGRFPELVRSRGDSLTVGRSFDNDLVVTDPYVAEHQLLLRREAGQWLLKVLAQKNLVTLNGLPVSGEVSVNSGDQLSIGRTKLSLFAADHPVPATKKLRFSNWLSGRAVNPFWPILVLAVSIALSFLLNYFEGSTSLQASEYASELIADTFLILFWAACWALLGRLLRHQHQLSLHLICASLASLLTALALIAIEYVIFPFHSVLLEENAGYLLVLVAFGLLLYCSLILATNLRYPAWVSLAVVVLIGATTYISAAMDEAQYYYYEDLPQYSVSLKPPLLNLYQGESIETYWAKVSVMVNDEMAP